MKIFESGQPGQPLKSVPATGRCGLCCEVVGSERLVTLVTMANVELRLCDMCAPRVLLGDEFECDQFE